MIKIEFPSENTRLAGAIGRALVEYSGAAVEAGFAELMARLKANPAVEVVADGAAIAETPQQVAPAEQAIAAVIRDMVNDEATPGRQYELGVVVESVSVDVALDRHGVAFNEQFCGKAEEPFYSTGPREGQWKKRRGVDDAAYDAWYNSQRAPAAAPATEFDASAAFGGAPAEAPAQNVPVDGAAFMVWTSEMLAAGRLKQPDINEAWQSLGLTPAHIFPPTTPDDIARNVGNLHAALSAVAGV